MFKYIYMQNVQCVFKHVTYHKLNKISILFLLVCSSITLKNHVQSLLLFEPSFNMIWFICWAARRWPVPWNYAHISKDTNVRKL